MKTEQSIVNLITRLWMHIEIRRRRQFILLLLLMIFSSFAEIISIGALLPFLSVLTSPDILHSQPLIQPLINILGLVSPEQLLIPLIIIFVITTLFAAAIRLLLLWSSSRLSFSTGADLSLDIYRRTLYQPYSVHISRNSSQVISAITTKTNTVIYNVLVPMVSLISAFIILVGILILLIYLNPLIAIISFGGFGLIYLIIIKFTRKHLLIDGQIIARETTGLIKCLNEGLGGIRDVLIDGTQDIYSMLYKKADKPLRRAQASSFFITQSPRYLVEALGMIFIAILAYFLVTQPYGITSAIPILGSLVLGAQRLLPQLQQFYSSWSSIRSAQSSLDDTLKLLDQSLLSFSNLKESNVIKFQESIFLNDIWFKYSKKNSWVFKNLSLTIKKGSRIGFIGKTGCGKSTLLDIVMGLLQPNKGDMKIDGESITASNSRSWQARIAHVPQTIFLADTTIEENIAFGVPVEKIDYSRVRSAAQQASIADIVESWPDKYKTFVGERGVRLSGGQRQRIGIARALYKQADVIIFDEATSSLDSDTEKSVMNAIESLSKNLTLLIVAHRLTTLKKCTHIVELANGSIKRVGSYRQIVNSINE